VPGGLAHAGVPTAVAVARDRTVAGPLALLSVG
jgi:hypothetical protein